jgi:hypothetical protein
MRKRKPKKEDITKTKTLIVTKTNSWEVLKHKKALCY